MTDSWISWSHWRFPTPKRLDTQEGEGSTHSCQVTELLRHWRPPALAGSPSTATPDVAQSAAKWLLDEFAAVMLVKSGYSNNTDIKQTYELDKNRRANTVWGRGVGKKGYWNAKSGLWEGYEAKKFGIFYEMNGISNFFYSCVHIVCILEKKDQCCGYLLLSLKEKAGYNIEYNTYMYITWNFYK